jgi:hypothetical protein
VKIEGVKIEGVKIEGDLPAGASRARRWRTSERQVATIGVEQKQGGARDDSCCDDAQCGTRPGGQKRPVDEKPKDSPECRHRLCVTRAFLQVGHSQSKQSECCGHAHEENEPPADDAQRGVAVTPSVI